MKTTLLFLVLAIFCLCYSNAYNKDCDDNPTLTGRGIALRTMWHFIKATRQCVSFLWGGQGYTNNFFASQEMCRQKCLT